MSEELLQAMARQIEEDRDEERERLDDRWDRLAAGELGARESAEIEALAARDEETRQAYEAFRPLGADFRRRVVGTLADQRPSREEASTGAKILPFRRARRWVGSGIAAAALAASLVFVFLPGAGVAPITDYDLLLGTGLKSERSASASASVAAEPIFVAGMEIEAVLRPAARIEGEIAVELFVESENGGLVPLVPGWIERAASGAVRLGIVLGEDVELAPGSYTLHALVGRPGALPQEDPRGRSAAGEGWRYLQGSFRIGQNP